MLAITLLAGCLIAEAVSVAIMFLAAGPVRVRRDVARVPGGPPAVSPMVADFAAQAPFSSAPPAPILPVEAPLVAFQPPVAPLNLRRPRTEQLAIRRERMAAGTSPPVGRSIEPAGDRPPHHFEGEEMTIPDADRPRGRAG